MDFSAVKIENTGSNPAGTSVFVYLTINSSQFRFSYVKSIIISVPQFVPRELLFLAKESLSIMNVQINSKHLE